MFGSFPKPRRQNWVGDADHDELVLLSRVSAHVPSQKTTGANRCFLLLVTNSAKCTILQTVDRQLSCTKFRQTQKNESPED